MARKRLRVVPWQGNSHVALVCPTRIDRSPTSADIRLCLEALDERGVVDAVTPALNRFEAEPFLQAGFHLHERLHLLALDLHAPNLVEPSQAGWRKVNTPESECTFAAGKSWHDNKVLEVDAKAFQNFWRFDSLALNDAKVATPTRRYRIARIKGKVVGYAITGRAGTRGYLQRLAVDPEVQGKGIGSALVADSCRWLINRGATQSLVNTQETNHGALGLYERLGFRQEPNGLVVLKWERGG